MPNHRQTMRATTRLLTATCFCLAVLVAPAAAGTAGGLCAHVRYRDVRAVAPGLGPQLARAYAVRSSRVCRYTRNRQTPPSSLVSRPPFVSVVQERLTDLYHRFSRLHTGPQVVVFAISGTGDTQRVGALGDYARLRWRPSPSPETGEAFFEAVWAQGRYEYSLWISSGQVTRAAGLRFARSLAARLPR